MSRDLSCEKAVSDAFDSGRESFALDVLEWLDNYQDEEEVEVGYFREFVEELLGWAE